MHPAANYDGIVLCVSWVDKKIVQCQPEKFGPFVGFVLLLH